MPAGLGSGGVKGSAEVGSVTWAEPVNLAWGEPGGSTSHRRATQTEGGLQRAWKETECGHSMEGVWAEPEDPGALGQRPRVRDFWGAGLQA